MTTIAYDGRIIAADSRITSGGYLSDDKFLKLRKIRIERRVLLAAAAGALVDILKFFKWVEGGMDADLWDMDEENLEGVAFEVVKTKLVIRLFSEGPTPMDTMCPFAIGSGGQFAEGAMLAGATAIDAVKIAAKRDLRTNAKVTAYHLVGREWTLTV